MTRAGPPRHLQRPGACTWCGHHHTGQCGEAIHLKDAQDARDRIDAPCPCKKVTVPMSRSAASPACSQ